MATHEHSHTHNDAHPHDIATANAAYFDEHAHTFDDMPGAQELLRRLALAMRKQYAFNEDETVMMDFACGTGKCIPPTSDFCALMLQKRRVALKGACAVYEDFGRSRYKPGNGGSV